MMLQRLTRARVACAVVGSLASACAPSEQAARTQVTLTIAELPVAIASQVDALRLALFVELERDGKKRWVPGSTALYATAGTHFPVAFPLLPNGAPDGTRLEVIIEALDGARVVANKRVITSWARDEHRVLRIDIPVCGSSVERCHDLACHGEDCTYCGPGDACERVHLEEGIATDTRDADGGVPDRSADAADGTAPEPQEDASAGPMQEPDGDASTPSMPDGSMATDGGGLDPVAAACPADNSCDPLRYPCVPTKLGWTCQGQYADWPMPDPTEGAAFAPKYKVLRDSVVDEVTGLEWQLNIPAIYPGCTGSSRDSQGVLLTDQGGTCTREQARSYCEALLQGGHDDWRLPSAIEITSIHGRYLEWVSIDRSIFGDTTYHRYITGSFATNSATDNWLGLFDLQAGVQIAAMEPGKVRCVRGGHEPPFGTPSERYRIDGEFVTDRATQLVWQRRGSSGEVEDAKSYCAAAGPNLRAPTSNELMTLVDFTRKSPAIDSDVFPTESAVYLADQRTSVWVDFERGELGTLMHSTGYVRCIQKP